VATPEQAESLKHNRLALKPHILMDLDGERGRNRTFNLLIKSLSLLSRLLTSADMVSRESPQQPA
jgi:hypothetical protein